MSPETFNTGKLQKGVESRAGFALLTLAKLSGAYLEVSVSGCRFITADFL